MIVVTPSKTKPQQTFNSRDIVESGSVLYKLERVIRSCKTPEHLEAAGRLLSNYGKITKYRHSWSILQEAYQKSAARINYAK